MGRLHVRVAGRLGEVQRQLGTVLSEELYNCEREGAFDHSWYLSDVSTESGQTEAHNTIVQHNNRNIFSTLFGIKKQLSKAQRNPRNVPH